MNKKFSCSDIRMHKMHNVCMWAVIAIFLAAGIAFSALPVQNGLVMHLDANSIAGLSSGQNVTLWQDASDSGNNATIGTGVVNNPTYVTNALNGLPVVRFGANNCYFTFPEIANIRTVFWVLKDSTTTINRFLLGHSTAYDFHRGQYNFWDSTYANANVKNGTTRLNGSVIDGTSRVVPQRYSIVSLITTGNVKANQLTRDRSNTAASWNGDIAEVIVYNRALTDSEEKSVGIYLTQKYGISTTYQPAKATEPIPSDMSTSVAIASDGHLSLSWFAGVGATSHNVYLGTSPSSLSLVSSGQSTTSYNAGQLLLSQKYYWRIDDISGSTVTEGDVWQFVTASYSIAPGIVAPLYVSPDGNDSSNGSIDHPFKTLERAQAAVRTLISQGLSADLHVYIREGTYYLSQPLYFTLADSGNSTNKVIWENYPGETPVISGGKVLSGTWVQTGTDLWQLTIPEVASGSWWFRQLWKNDVRCQRSRWPGAGQTPVYISSVSGNLLTLNLNATIAGSNFVAYKTEVIVFHQWNTARSLIASVNGNAVTTTDICGVDVTGELKPQANEPVFFENNPDYINQPTEWYLDCSTGALTYKSSPGENPNNDVFVAPILEKLVVINGGTNLHFDGIEFRDTKFDLPVGGYHGIQGGHYRKTYSGGPEYVVPPAFAMIQTGECEIRNCRFSNLAAGGLYLGAGCTNNVVQGCAFEDIGGNGFMCGWRGDVNSGQTSFYSDWPNVADAPTNNLLTNNYFNGIDQEWFGCVGIYDGFAKFTEISHNIVENTNYTGISIGFVWNNTPYSQQGTQVISNHVHDVMKLLWDGGAIYTLGNFQGGLLNGNLLHNIQAGWGRSDQAWLNNAIFFDQGTSNLNVTNNISYTVPPSSTQIRFNTDSSAITFGTNYWNWNGSGATAQAIAAAAGTNAGTVTLTLSWTSDCNSVLVTGLCEPWATLQQVIIQGTSQDVSGYITIGENGAIKGLLPRSLINPSGTSLSIVTVDPDGHLSGTGYSNTITIVAGDVTCDGLVDLMDLAKMAENWLMGNCGNCNWTDLNGDNKVNFADIAIIGRNWLSQ